MGGGLTPRRAGLGHGFEHRENLRKAMESHGGFQFFPMKSRSLVFFSVKEVSVEAIQ